MPRHAHQDRFDHLVVLMLENRSFNYTSSGISTEDDQPKRFIPDDETAYFEGWQGVMTW